jgi:predicted AAA+ superfamily ATPase
MNIKKELEKIISTRLYIKKAIIVIGPRQVGKTTLLNQIAQTSGKKVLFLNIG